jgi:hypothetical protein
MSQKDCCGNFVGGCSELDCYLVKAEARVKELEALADELLKAIADYAICIVCGTESGKGLAHDKDCLYPKWKARGKED